MMNGFFLRERHRAAAGATAALLALGSAGAAAETWREAPPSYAPVRDFIDADSLVRLRPDGQIFEVRRKQLLPKPEPSGANALIETVAVDCESVGHVVMTQEWRDEASGAIRDKARWSRSRAEALHTLATDVLVRNREPRRAAATCQAVRAVLSKRAPAEDFSAAEVVPEKPSLPSTFQGRARPNANAQEAPRIVAGQMKVGTGFFVAANGTFVTAAHVVSACQAITIEAKGASAPARIISIDRTRDIALGRAEVMPRAFARFASGTPRQGEQVVSFGFPLAGAVASGGNTNTGYVAALAGLRDDPTMLQVSVPVQPGNSGGPLVDLSGGVIGVIKGKLRAEAVFAATGALPENVNFATKAGVVMEMMKGARIPYETITAATPKSVADASEEVRQYTVRVNCR